VAASIREQIIEAALAALNTSTPTGVPQADRLRMEPYQLADMPAMVVMPLREEVEPLKDGRWGPLVNRTLTLRIACYAYGDAIGTVGGQTADKKIDPLLTWADAALDSNQFGGLANDSLPALIEWQYAAEDQPFTVALADYRIMYQTKRADATATQ
jgi:hypothetical protein